METTEPTWPWYKYTAFLGAVLGSLAANMAALAYAFYLEESTNLFIGVLLLMLPTNGFATIVLYRKQRTDAAAALGIGALVPCLLAIGALVICML